jgi:hypothetical protein
MSSKLWASIRFIFFNKGASKKAKQHAVPAKVYIGPQQHLLYRSNYNWRNRRIDNEKIVH